MFSSFLFKHHILYVLFLNGCVHVSVVTIIEFYLLSREGGGMCYWCVTFLDAQMGLQCA